MVSKSLRQLSSTTDIASLSESDKCYLTQMQDAVEVLLKGIGEDPSREGLRDTPRVRIDNAFPFTSIEIVTHILHPPFTIYRESQRPG